MRHAAPGPFHDEPPPGRAYDARPYSVVKQNPDAGTKAKPGSPVDIYCTKEDD